MAKSNWRLIAVSDMAKRLSKRSFELKFGANRVGRLDTVEVPIPSNRCSRNQCIINVNNQIVELIDNSKNGTFVNDTRICNARSKPLNEKDTITIGFQLDGQFSDKNAYVYTLARDPTDTINLVDSDDEFVHESELDCGAQNDSASMAAVASADIVPDREILISVSTQPNTDEHNQQQFFETTPSNTLHTSTKNVTGPSTSQIRNVAAKSRQQTPTQNRLPLKRKQNGVNEAFKTKVKVKVAKYSRGEMLIADMMTNSRNIYDDL